MWAEGVIADHPEHNVILGTHEYLRPEIDERATHKMVVGRLKVMSSLSVW